ncbi:MAG: AMP-binding protein, partial [Burkholderiales bacterium]|nr:AMP-binding protein [Burkholderiales bacterium]
GLTSTVDVPVKTLSLMDGAAHKALLVDSRGLDTVVPGPKQTLASLFDEQALRTPSLIAINFGDIQLTYEELNARADRLARYLIQHGAGPEKIVAVLLDRSPDMIIALLAVLKSGAAYLPLDPDYPASRLEFMVSDSQACALVTTKAAHQRLEHDIAQSRTDSTPKHPATSMQMLPMGLQLVDVESSEVITRLEALSERPISDCDRLNRLQPDHLAYLIYTSGSTGRPKGVGMPHQAIVNLIRWQENEIQDLRQRILQYSPISFDVSAQEISYALTKGHTLVLVRDDVRRDNVALIEHLDAQHVDQLYVPFVVLNSLADTHDSLDVATWPKTVITAGEQLQITPSIRKIFQQNRLARLHNHYGPTESHVVSSYSLSNDVETWEDLPPIGRPIW